MVLDASRVATVVLAGGQGTRLHPLTMHHAKPAVSYGGRYRLIDIPISNAINSGLREIYVIAQYLSAELQHHIQQTYHFDWFHPGSVDVLTPQENEKGVKEWFAGTADAVRKNLPTLLKSQADYFLILAGDQLYNIDFQEMISFAHRENADLTIASLPISAKEAKRMGVLKIDHQHRVVEFIEKPKEPTALHHFLLSSEFYSQYEIEKRKEPHYLGSMGIYVFKRESLVKLLEQDARHDFGFHLIDTAVKTTKTVSYVYHGYWEDIGTVASYFDANLILTQSTKGLNTYDEKNPIYTRPTFLPGPRIFCTQIADSIICEGSLIEAAEIHRSIIGLRSRIERGTVLKETVMMGNHFYMPPSQSVIYDYGIGKNCQIEKAIIDEHVQIGDNVKLINKQRLTEYEGAGLFIRDGIIIVPAGAVIPAHFEL